MGMRTKDFEVVAQAVYEANFEDSEDRWHITDALTGKFNANYPNFDPERFRTWCVAGPPDTHWKFVPYEDENYREMGDDG